jgi:hypothetical protein
MYNFLSPGFLSSLSESHKYWCGSNKKIAASAFQAAFSSGFLPMTSFVDSLESLDVHNFKPPGAENVVDPFCRCPFCCRAPEGEWGPNTIYYISFYVSDYLA